MTHLRNIRRMVCALTALILIMAAWTPAAMAAATYAATVNTGTKLYQKASLSSRTQALPKSTSVTILSMNGTWAQVRRSNGTVGYCRTPYLTLKQSLAGTTTKKTWLYRSASTASGRTALSQGTNLWITGRSGSFLHVRMRTGSASGYVPLSAVKQGTSSPATGASAMKSKLIVADWYKGGAYVFKRDAYASLYDIDTGITIRIKRMGGVSHADVEPATAADTAKLRKIARGAFSWTSHACVLIVGGHYYACAINTMPHGRQTIHNNNYEGQFCLHMVNSRTHCSDNLNAAHQASIRRVISWASR